VVSWANEKEMVPSAMPRPIAIARILFMCMISLKS
jgi:hypothetical protein